MRRRSLAMVWLFSALSRQNQTALSARPEKKHGHERKKTKRQEQRQAARDAAPEGQDSALAALVGQSGKSRHDRALSRALHELRAHAEGAALRQADHRHRADRLGPLAV